jgi:vitamin B12/bleomycin/antimicrobial peptide transport system ATP-binding/permease protein
MYDLVREQLPESTIVSVGHRSTLEALHSEELTLLGDGRWQVQTLVN